MDEEKQESSRPSGSSAVSMTRNDTESSVLPEHAYKSNGKAHNALEEICFDRPVLEWDGPDDPANPRNWPFSKRAFNTGIPAVLCFLMLGLSTAINPCITTS